MNSIHSKGAHSMGSLIHDYCTEVAVIGNFYAHNNERNPWYKGFATGVIVNNLIYNPGVWAIRLGYVAKEWTSSGITPEPPRVSIVGNYLVQGADTPSGKAMVGSNSEGQAYLEDNLIFDSSGNSALLTSGITILESKPIWVDGLNPLPAAEVPEYILQHAGARPRDRDSVDQRLITDYRNAGGGFIDSQEDVGGYLVVAPVYRQLDVPDQDIDGWLDSLAKALI